MSGIDNAKAAMRYIKAHQRPSCCNCLYGQERDCIHPTWWCEKGAFLTSAMATCIQHEAAGRPARKGQT